jgi:hypothetical protein
MQDREPLQLFMLLAQDLEHRMLSMAELENSGYLGKVN